MLGVWKGRQRGVGAHHAVKLVGPLDLSRFHIHRPTAEAGHALRLFQLRFAGAQGFLRLLALGDIADHGGGARDMAFRVADGEDRDRHVNPLPAFANPFGFVVEDGFPAGDSLEKAHRLVPANWRPQ